MATEATRLAEIPPLEFIESDFGYWGSHKFLRPSAKQWCRERQMAVLMQENAELRSKVSRLEDTVVGVAKDIVGDGLDRIRELEAAPKTSEEMVLVKFPHAVWSSAYGAIYDDSETSRERLSGPTWWTDEPSAWDDAASRLEAAHGK